MGGAAGTIAREQHGGEAFDAEQGLAALLGLAGRMASGAERLPASAVELLGVRRCLARALLQRLSEARPDTAPIAAAVDALAVGVAVDAPVAELARLDLDVVEALVQASDSEVLPVLMGPVRAVVERAPALQAAMYASPLHNLACYHALLAWLDDPGPEGIQALVGLLAATDAVTTHRLTGPARA